jgi:hypothetical protein
MMVTPATMLQHNWFKLQDYAQRDQFSYFQRQSGLPVHKVSFMYVPEQKEKGAALNFHLTAREKRDIAESFHSPINQRALQQLQTLMRPPVE